MVHKGIDYAPTRLLSDAGLFVSTQYSEMHYKITSDRNRFNGPVSDYTC